MKYIIGYVVLRIVEAFARKIWYDRINGHDQ